MILNKATTIVLLDRNLVSTADQKNRGKAMQGKEQHLAKLDSFDKSEYAVTALTSMIEGGRMRREGAFEMASTLERETEILKKYFRNAVVDDHSRKMMWQFIGTFTQSQLENESRYTGAIKYLRSILKDTVRDEDVLKKRREILNQLIDRDVYPTHPIAVCALAIIHKNELAHSLFYPKKKKKTTDQIAYNVLNDLQVFQIYWALKALLKKDFPSIEILFATCDKALNHLSEQIILKRSIFHSNSQIKSDLRIDHDFEFGNDLFPLLKKMAKEQQPETDEIQSDAFKSFYADIEGAVARAKLVNSIIR